MEHLICNSKIEWAIQFAKVETTVSQSTGAQRCPSFVPHPIRKKWCKLISDLLDKNDFKMVQWWVCMQWMDIELSQDGHKGHFIKEVNVHEARWISMASTEPNLPRSDAKFGEFYVGYSVT